MLPLRVAQVSVGLALVLAVAGCAPPAPDAFEIERLALRIGATPGPPGAGMPLDTETLRQLGGWEEVPVPDVWGLRRRAGSVAGWYRAAIVLPAARSDWTLLLEGAWQEVAVHLDGLRLGGSARDGSLAPFSYPASSSLLIPIPEGRERVELLLHFRTTPAELGFLTGVKVGPREAMAAAAQRHELAQRTLPNALGVIGLVGGLLVLALARFRDTPGVYWFGAATSLWCLAFLMPAEPASALGWLTSVIGHGFVPAVAIALHRVVGVRRPFAEAVLIAGAAIGALLRAIVAPLFIPAVDIAWWLVNFAIGLYLLPLAVRSQRLRAITGARWVLFAGLVLVAAGLHDVGSLVAGRMLLVPFSLFAAATPVIAIAAAGAIVSALAGAMREVRTLNAELERRVDEKRRELDASYARTAQLERERTIAAERERMMRDMHDGTGGQLVSALSLVEGGEFRVEDLAETLRAALADLRLSIDSLEAGPPDLLAVLALARTRLEGRLEHHGVRFAWEVEDVPAPAGFGPEHSLHVLRIFQEAVTNALKHARAKTITVRTGTTREDEGPAAAFVEITDDGMGIEAAAALPDDTGGGRGLRNMRRRAQEIGATVSIASDASGTTVRLRLPLP